MTPVTQKSNFLTAIIVFVYMFGPLKVISQPVPQFKMMLSDNKIFVSTDLPKSKPMILIYFDPECDHCQKLMNEFFKKINEFKKVDVLMVTFKSLDELVAFEKKYNTKKYSNIKVGSEGTSFRLRMYYGLRTMPFTALYDKNGNLNYSYRKETSVQDLISRLKGLL